jgi:hypothetical protein
MQSVKNKQTHNWRVDLGNGYWYDNTPDYYGLNETSIQRIERMYNCRYVTEWNLLDIKGNPQSYPYLVFWNDQSHPEGSNWMGMYKHQNDYYVCDAITASQHPIECMVSNDKQVLFSKYRHDFRTSKDSSVTVDGGREYTRVLGAVRNESVWLVPRDGKLEIVPETMASLMSKRNK